MPTATLMKKLLDKKCFIYLFSSVVFLWSGQCGAAGVTSGPWEIDADRITRYGNPLNVVAEGNVVLRRVEEDNPNPLTIKADWIRYNVDDGVVHARGNLSMRNTNEDVDAGEAVIDLNRETATLTDTTLFMPENNLHFSGHEVEKTDALTYRFKDGDFSTCKVGEGETRPWEFQSAEAIVRIENTVVLKHTVLRVRDVPVFYLPYMILPANSKRKTGFLIPEFSQSTLSGTGLITPFFVDLSPSADVTLYPGYLSKRGVVAGVEFRYMSDYNSRATIAGTYIYDKTKDSVDDDYKSDDYLRSEHNRYWIRGKFDHDFGNNLMARADIDLASDRDYLQELGTFANGFDESDAAFLRDYNRGLAEETLPYRPSQLQLVKTWSSSLLGGQFVSIDDLVDEDGTAQVNTLPRLIYNGVFELEKMPLSFSWDSEYVNYYRDEGVGEQRIDLFPRLTAPLPFGRLIEGSVTAGLRETIYRVDAGGSDYDWDFDRDQERTAWTMDANLATTFDRDFGMKLGSVSWLNHVIRPELEYSYVSVDSQDELPEIDTVDRIDLTNLLTYSLNNYFRVGGTDDDGTIFNRYIGYLKISQSYDIHEERRDISGPDDERQPFSDIDLILNIYPLPRWQLKYETAYNVYGQGVTKYDLYSKYTSRRGDSVSLDYRYTKKSDVNQINAEVLAKLTESLYLEGELQQSLYTDEIVSSSVGLLYNPGCWAMKVYFEKTPDDERVAVMFSLVGLGQALGFGVSGDFQEGFSLDSGSDGLDFE